ncbi:hypothetical protein [Paractinoplanes deccanensis]|nr:hypothetical protein [Actinoplanes deccanensis]
MAEFETTIETPNGYKVTHCFRSSNRDDVRAVAYDSLQAVLQAAARAELQSRMIDAGFSRDLVELLWGDSRPQWQLPRR